MEKKEIEKYVGKKVLLILKNSYKFTVIIPKFEGDSFNIVDKFGHRATIECEMVSMIYEKGGSQ